MTVVSCGHQVPLDQHVRLKARPLPSRLQSLSNSNLDRCLCAPERPGVDPLSWTPHSGEDPEEGARSGSSVDLSRGVPREACELARRGDRSIRQVAAGLGIPDQTLCNWLKAEDKARARGQDPESLSESELSELKRLRKENAELKMDREILLKASVFFAKETNR